MNENIKMKDILKISVTKPSQYINLLGVKLKKIILAILIASIIPGVITGVSKAIMIGEGIDLVEDVLKDEENTFEIKNGILNFDKTEVTLEELNSILYISTNKEIKDIDSLRSILVHKEIYSAFLKDGFSAQYGDQKTEFKYSEIPNLENLNNEKILNILELGQNFKYVIILIEIVSIFINMIIESVIIYLLGSLICKFKKILIPSLQLYKMSILALMLPAILHLNNVIGNYSIIIGGIYITLSINAIRNNLIEGQKENNK